MAKKKAKAKPVVERLWAVAAQTPAGERVFLRFERLPRLFTTRGDALFWASNRRAIDPAGKWKAVRVEVREVQE